MPYYMLTIDILRLTIIKPDSLVVVYIDYLLFIQHNAMWSVRHKNWRNTSMGQGRQKVSHNTYTSELMYLNCAEYLTNFK